MLKYKAVLHKLSLTVLTLVFFAGCIKPQKKSAADLEAEGTDNSASFYAKEITGKAFSKKVGSGWKIPVSTQFNLQVCLQDKRTQDDIRLGKFAILGGETDIHKRSDNNGCVNWTENIPFELLGVPSYVEIVRQIKSEGLQTGQRTLKIALNPWGSLAGFSNEPVIDLTKHDAPDEQLVTAEQAKQVLHGLTREGQTLTRHLNIDSLSVESTDLNQAGTSRSIQTQVHFKPFLVIPVTSGDPLKWELTAGQVNVEVSWIASVHGRKTLISRAKTKSPLTLNDNMTFSALFSPLNMQAPADGGTIEFAIKVTPVDGPKNLAAYQGVFNLGGGVASVLGSHTLDPSANLSVADKGDFSIESYVSKSAPGGPTSADVSNLKEFAIEHLKASDVHLSENTNNSKTIGLSLSSRLLDSVSGSPRVGVPLRVKDSQGVDHSLQTDELGQFSWNESIKYNPYEADHTYQTAVTVTTAEGFVQCIPLRLDPWVYDAHAPTQVAVDARELNSSSTCENASVTAAGRSLTGPGAASVAQIKLNGYVLTEQGRAYSADKHLQLKSTQTATLDLDASMLMPPDRITQQRAALPLGDGYYYARMAVRLPPLGVMLNEEIGWDQQLIRAEGGKLRPVTFNFDISDVRAFGSRTQLYIEISPVDQAKVGSMRLDAAMKIYPHPQDLLPKDKTWSPRLFVAPYVVGGGQQMMSFYAMDEILGGKVDTSAMQTTGAALSVVGHQVVSENFFVTAKRYADFDQLAAQAAALKNQRERDLAFAEQPRQMQLGLNMFAYDTTQNRALLNHLGLDKINVQTIFNHQIVTHDDLNLMCHVWTHDVLPSAMKEAKIITRFAFSSTLAEAACRNMQAKLPSMDWLMFKLGTHALTPFVFERRMQVLDAAPSLHAVGQNTQMTLMVGNAFNATYSKLFQASSNLGGEITGGLQIPKISFIDGQIGMKVSAVRTDASVAAVNNAQIVTAMVPLTVTKQVLKLQVRKFRSCVVISAADDFREMATRFLIPVGMNRIQLASVLDKKLMLCDAPHQVSTGKVLAADLYENYYIVSAPVSDTRTEDGATADSHLWGSVIRGDADFANFLAMAARSEDRSDVTQSLKMAIPEFIKQHASLTIGHPGYYVMPDL